MIEKGDKKTAKPKKDEKGVLAALPSTRPERIGTRRSNGAPEAAGDKLAAAKPPGAKPAAAKTAGAKPTSAKTARAKPSPAAAKTSKTRAPAARKPPAQRATAARRKAAAPRTFEPTSAAEAAAGAADERAAGATVSPPRGAEPLSPRPRPVREGAPGIGTTGAREQPSTEHGRPSGTELVATAVQAAGELAQLGLTIGGRLLKRAAERLPRP